MMPTSKFVTEGISHLEDLDLQSFILSVKNIAKMHASEKLDGSQLWFGLDSAGNLFTSREGKRSRAARIYDVSDYPLYAANNGFRAAHAALKAKEQEIKTILRNGDMVEIEVLFGRQPNAVVYGAGQKNYIAFLRGVEGTPDTLVDLLSTNLNNSTVKVAVEIVDSTDGVKIELTKTELVFQFVGAQKISTSGLHQTDVTKHLQALEKYLQSASPVKGVSVFELVTKPITAIPKEQRDAAKKFKSEALARITSDFKLPIKKELLDKFVSKIKSPLAADDISQDEDLGIEGVVLRDPETGNQIKLVDKDTFTTVNSFNHSIRAALSGPVRTTDPQASDESRGGITGNMYIRIADLIGNKELARGTGARKALAIVKGASAEDTIRNFAKEVKVDDLLGMKRKIRAIIEDAQTKISNALAEFKSNKDTYRLKLKNGKTIGLSAEIVRRTLVAFAETKRNIDELHDKVSTAKTMAQLLAVLYGRAAKQVHDDAEVSESLLEQVQLLSERRFAVSKELYTKVGPFELLNAFVATYIASAVIIKSNDAPGIRLLRDKTHMRLKAWDENMSPLNFWGYPIWRSGTPAVKKLLKKNAAEIFKYSRRVPPAWWKFMHIDMSFGREVPIDWADHKKLFAILRNYPGLNVDRVNRMLDSVFNFENLSLDDKVKFLNKLYYYLQQFVPSSPLFERIHRIMEKTLSGAGDGVEAMESMKLLRSVAVVEDAAGDATIASNISDVPVTAGDRKIVKWKRNPNINRHKFSRPVERQKS